MAQALKKSEVSDAPVIPDRLYFKIGDVARICGVETYVLRFWETQFPQLKPNKGGTGQRLYKRREVELALEIKRLVHREGYTIAGAKQVLDAPQKPQAVKPAVPSVVVPKATEARVETRMETRTETQPNVTAAIGRARAELREILSMLDGVGLGSVESASAAVPGVPHVTVRTKAKILRVRAESEPLFPL
jgi:DNA-binding transcriptional MerR regulator